MTTMQALRQDNAVSVHGSDPSLAPVSTPARLVSLDAYRGLIMVLMVSGGFGIKRVVETFDATPGWQQLHTPLWDQLVFQTDHTLWTGCSLWDLIQPSFMFMVGAAMAFSLASRKAKGQSFVRMLFHGLYRSLALVLLSIFLQSSWSRQTHWSFENVLAQIGLGYPILFLVAWLKPKWQFAAAMAILFGYWCAFAFYHPSPDDLKLALDHLTDKWPRLAGFASHWDKDTNWAAHVDQWFLNLFPRESGKRYTFNEGGYQTLNFIPSIATMIFGLLAGQLAGSRLAGLKKVGIMLAAGVVALAVGWSLGKLGICPISKRIWTPSWAIFSAGWALAALGFFYLVLDVLRIRGWEYPFKVFGANAIAVYCIWQVMGTWVRESMHKHFGPHVYELPGRAYAWLRYDLFTHTPHPPDTIVAYGLMFVPMAEAGFFLLFCWVLCWWAYRRKVFIKL